MNYFFITCGLCQGQATAWPDTHNVTNEEQAKAFFEKEGWQVGKVIADNRCPNCKSPTLTRKDKPTMKRPITLTVAPPETEQEKEALERFMTDDPSLLLARIMDVHANYLTKNPAKINQELLAALEELTPAMPPKDAPCHYGLVPQEECANCQRIAKAHAAIARAKG